MLPHFRTSGEYDMRECGESTTRLPVVPIIRRTKRITLRFGNTPVFCRLYSIGFTDLS